MLETPHAIALTAALTWLMIITAATMRNRGPEVAFSNRDAVPTPSPAAARADRAAKNMLENLALFAVVLLAAFAAGETRGQVRLGANLFLAARLLYFPVYVAGIKYLRTILWAIGVFALGLIGAEAF
jgi:uncharacterized MAPEG superfamily protein